MMTKNTWFNKPARVTPTGMHSALHGYICTQSRKLKTLLRKASQTVHLIPVMQLCTVHLLSAFPVWIILLTHFNILITSLCN